MYIVSPHEAHYEYAKAALKHKRHVLCEKPVVFRRAQAEELFELSKEQGCVLMEAIKTAYSPRFNQLVMTAKSGVIGEIRDVEANFTRLTDPAMLLGVIGSAVSLCIALVYLILKLVN